MRIILSYSGGLDTTVAISLLKERLKAEIITVTVDVGQKEDFEKIEETALKVGAIKHYLIDAKNEFLGNYVLPCIKMNCLYEEQYPLGTALARPLIAKKVVEIAKKEGANAIAHGSTSKGNDQVRFDLTIMAEVPDKQIITPVRKWRLTREWELSYAKKKGIPIKNIHASFSIDENLWSRSIEGDVIDDATKKPPESAFEWTVPIDKTPSTPQKIVIEFKEGVPTAIDGEELSLKEIVTNLNKIGGTHGIGRIDMIENRLVGLKSREVYEAPAATILIASHKELEKMVYTPREYRFKRTIDQMWSDLVYQGLWHEPLRKTLQQTGENMNKWVSGAITLELYKGNIIINGRYSKYSLYDEKKADYNKGWYPTEEEAVGFIRIWGFHSLDSYWKRGE